MQTVRRLVVALLLAAGCVLVGSAAGAVPTAPCSCGTGTVQDDVRQAAAVFRGTVEVITPQAGDGQGSFSRTSEVVVDRVYKPQQVTLSTTGSVEVMTTRAFGNCTRDLVEGETYVFFVESDEGYTATGCGGTTRATTTLITQVERLLGPGRDPVPPPPTTAEITPVGADEPASLTRLAAPGAALIIVGLLGLAVVRRLGRPRH